MRNYLLLLLSCAMAASTATAQEVVKVGKGSYASYTPLEMCRTEYHKPGDWGYQGDQSKNRPTALFLPTTGGQISSLSLIPAVCGRIRSSCKRRVME